MRLLWIRFRCFVHATEDEGRVRQALLRTMGLEGVERATDRVTRTRAKGHHGNDILVLEGTLKGHAAEPALERLLHEPMVRATLIDDLGRHLDEESGLHLRLDKQEAVLGRLAPTGGGDAIVVTAKLELHGSADPAQAWGAALAR